MPSTRRTSGVASRQPGLDAQRERLSEAARRLSLEEFRKLSTSRRSPHDLGKERTPSSPSSPSLADSPSSSRQPTLQQSPSFNFTHTHTQSANPFTTSNEVIDLTTPHSELPPTATELLASKRGLSLASAPSSNPHPNRQIPPKMVREQAPAKTPFSPSRLNIQQVPQVTHPDLAAKEMASNPQSHQIPRSNEQNAVRFGSPTPLGTVPVRSSRHQADVKSGDHAGPQVSSNGPNDLYSNLFISSKQSHKRPEHQKDPLPQKSPSVTADWMGEQARKYVEAQAPSVQNQRDSVFNRYQPDNASSTRPDVPLQDDDAVEIPQPTQYPTWAPRAATGPQMFSSQTASNPYFPKRNLVDLTATTIGVATNAELFDDRFGAADPFTYVDSEKANENIKALLEGAFEDEDDKPRTRLRKQKLNNGYDDLLGAVQGLHVKKEQVNGDEETEEDDGSVEGLKVKLLPHQIDGVAWMRDKELGTRKTRGVLPKGGILADDMGLGKTIQSIALMLTNPRPPIPNAEEGEKAARDKNKRQLPRNLDKGTLVVAPLALIKQWEGEIKERIEHSDALRVCVHHGPQRAKSYKELKKYDVVITTYHTLVSEHGNSEGNLKVGCFGLHWYRVILDEAHSIKNRNAKATKAACALDAEYRWCLTGTPMQNNLDELQSLIHFLRIKPYEDVNAWRDQITRPMSNGRGGLAIRRLQVYLKAFMKRRTKDILKQEGALGASASGLAEDDKAHGFRIVNRTVEKIEAVFTPNEQAFYQRLESRADKSLEQMMAGNKVSYASALVLLLRLRQACNHPDLIKGDLAKEKDMFANEIASGSQTPGRRKAASKDDMDSIADILGGLSVATKRCDVCQIELRAKESSKGMIRCAGCEADLDDQDVKLKVKKEKTKHKQRQKQKKESFAEARYKFVARSQQNRRFVLDSDDDEVNAEDEWVPPESQHDQRHMPQVDNADDEDAEVGGKSTATDSEDNGIKPVWRKKEDAIDTVTNDDKEESSEEHSEDDEGNSEEEERTSEDSSSEEMISVMASPKIRHLLSILKSDAHQHKYIVFSFFTSMLDLIEPFLRRAKLSFTRYDGQMRNDLREASLDRLRNHDETRILLCSLRAGSLGLNLTAACRVVILEPFWNPFVEEQAIDRVHRLNQTKDVVVYKMTIKDTVEARILELQERKRELANATIEGKAAAGKLTLQDMLKLFRHDAEGTHEVDGLGMGLGRGGLLQDKEGVEQINIGKDKCDHRRREGSGGPQSLKQQQQQRRKEHEVYGRRW